ncbi:MFS transporter [Rhodobacteraceae bacterium RKSG542]|uniref:MFS transporter n=1 Tax=Pseudovibrio flavus TaxID=2529854 RepID=UPI0012BBC2BE|nr:MFS transporter [Pseudovibrio flavus]MTI18707.1 MFS transporter [Pseudovibrio flavus]
MSTTRSDAAYTALLIFCGCMIAMISFGPRSAMGLYLSPMTMEHGWTRESFAMALAIQNLAWGAAQPLAGAIADKFGVGRTVIIGAVLYAAGLYLMTQVSSPLEFQLTAGVLMGAGIGFSSFGIILSAFARTIPVQQRSIAFGLGTAAGSFGQFLFAPLGQALIDGFGWQQSLLVLAGLFVLLPILVIPLRGNAQSTPAQDSGEIENLPQALALAFKTRSYLLLTAGFFVCGFHVAFITVHMPAYISDLGFSPAWGAWALALIGLFNIVGSIASGFISGRYSKPYFLSLIYLGRSVAILAFIMLPITPASILVFSAVMGLLWLSTVPPTSGLVVVMFGPKFMGTLFGIVFFSHQVGSFLGIWLGGKFYDETGSYDPIWWLGIALGILAALIHWPIRETAVSPAKTALA